MKKYIFLLLFLASTLVWAQENITHGEANNNSGTFPIQTERLYNAIKGHGGTARYVVLPYESHGYAAKESILHTLWEMDRWLETYVKNADKQVRK